MSAFRMLADATRSFFRADGNDATDVASLRLLPHSGTRLETLTHVGGYRRNAWGVIAEIRMLPGNLLAKGLVKAIGETTNTL